MNWEEEYSSASESEIDVVALEPPHSYRENSRPFLNVSKGKMEGIRTRPPPFVQSMASLGQKRILAGEDAERHRLQFLSERESNWEFDQTANQEEEQTRYLKENGGEENIIEEDCSAEEDPARAHFQGVQQEERKASSLSRTTPLFDDIEPFSDDSSLESEAPRPRYRRLCRLSDLLLKGSSPRTVPQSPLRSEEIEISDDEENFEGEELLEEMTEERNFVGNDPSVILLEEEPVDFSLMSPKKGVNRQERVEQLLSQHQERETSEREDWRLKYHPSSGMKTEIIWIDDCDDFDTIEEFGSDPSSLEFSGEQRKIENLSTPREKMFHHLHSTFGHKKFREFQQRAVENALESRDTLLVLATGAGKSLCFQLPPMIQSKVAIVVSPLIALMQNQLHQCLHQFSICAELISSETKEKDRDRIIRNLCGKRTSIRLLYLTPEFINTDRCKSLLQSAAHNICLFAIDEAHCISEWGNDFRPAYRKLSALRTYVPKAPILAMTATATTKTLADIQSSLQLRSPLHLQGSFNRPNIKYSVRFKDLLKDPFEDLVSYLRQYQNKSGIVYTYTRADTENLCQKLVERGFSAGCYHAGVGAGKRSNVLMDWTRDKIRIVVATIAFGMGIDKKDVRFVVHWHFPGSFENFYQESGRCGRDGNPASHLLYYSQLDYRKVLRMTVRSTKRESPRRVCAVRSIETLKSYCLSSGCFRRQILSFFGEQYHHPSPSSLVGGGSSSSSSSIKIPNRCCDVCENPSGHQRLLHQLTQTLQQPAAKSGVKRKRKKTSKKTSKKKSKKEPKQKFSKLERKPIIII